MAHIIVEQAIYGSVDAGGYRFLARSPGFLEAWLPEAQRLCTGFGERPAGVACPAAVFAHAFGRRHVAIVQVADQGIDDAGRPGALGFHLLILPRSAYRGFGGDPFLLANRGSPPWGARDELPSLEWPAEPLAPRSVDDVQKVLKRPDGPNLLGGSQILVDGGRVVFERCKPDGEVLRDLWTLLPTSTRADLWPASFAFGNALRFHALATANTEGDEFTHYHTESQAGDYPEGRYELGLQAAAEAGDQSELDRLFARRSQADTLRIGLYLLAAAVVILFVVGLMSPTPPAPSKTQKQPTTPKQEQPASSRLDLPPLDQCPMLSHEDRKRIARELARLAERVGVWPDRELQVRQASLSLVQIPHDGLPGRLMLGAWIASDSALLLYEPSALLGRIDRQLSGPHPRRDLGPLSDLGPIQRQLRAVLWKHRVADYNDPRLNPFELVEKLEQVVAQWLPAEH